MYGKVNLFGSKIERNIRKKKYNIAGAGIVMKI